jgi:lipopolysaccharide/colanic/teichoic acid biosynthesis glycosyltransferase
VRNLRDQKTKDRYRSDVQGLLSPFEFRRELDKERARVDRFGGELSLLVLSPHDEADRERTLKETARILVERKRATDEVGWIGRNSIGAILTGTDAGGAWRVSEIVCERLDKDVLPPAFQVYTYPDHEDFPRNGSPRGDESTDSRSEDSRWVRSLHEVFVEPMPIMKRAIDVVLSGMALLLLLPLFTLVAIAIKWTSPGPVIFSQQRMGRGRRPFTLHKFRSMSADAERQKQKLLSLNEVDGPVFKIACDPRVTPLGKLLRASCIDELPQLWNVLVGEMSLVGPRPLPWDEACKCIRWQTRRFDVAPGLTCFWQVKESRNSIPFTDWMRLDLDYIRRSSLQEDLRLIWKTGLVMLGGRSL